jgi:hypothetical protein
MTLEAERIAHRIEKLMIRWGLALQDNFREEDKLWNTEPLLGELYGASASSRVATGPRAGHRIIKVRDEIDVDI